ncbi:MAG: glycosyltransferase family 2 protein [Clostridia bacterium]
MKISIIMPTYNDAKTIEKSIYSVFEQSYSDWELIIVDDGSTDNTKAIVDKCKKNKDGKERIKYIYQENKDQLNAILNAIDYISGDYIFILHSDDLINEKDSLEKCVFCMEEHKELDSIIGDLTIIDENDNITGKQVVKKYVKKEYMIPLQLLWLGRNLYVDVGFHRRNAYINKIKNNYLLWNTPFWINFSNKIEMLNVKKVDFSFYKYRVFEENYINDINGQLNVINGELRTAIKIMKEYTIPFYRIQYILFRIFNKLNLNFMPLYLKKEQKNKADIIDFIIRKRFKNSYKNNIYLNSLLKYYKTSSKRELRLDDDIQTIYFGKDVRNFNKKLIKGDLENFYIKLFNEMQIGFNKIIVKDDFEKEKLKNICEFIGIDSIIEVFKENRNEN